MTKRKSRNKSLLIVFYRNPELGKVKTRLASSIGEAKAYSIYLLLCEHTRGVIEDLPVHKALFYSDFIDTDDIWSNDVYQKHLQTDGDLGEKMDAAFRTGFNAGYTSICIIGTDCLELTGKIVTEAFKKLLTHDIVIGPAADGGYYLLGMKHIHPALFKNKNWGSDAVLTQTLDDIKQLGLTCWQMQALKDVDHIEDLPPNFQLDNQ